MMHRGKLVNISFSKQALIQQFVLLYFAAFCFLLYQNISVITSLILNLLLGINIFSKYVNIIIFPIKHLLHSISIIMGYLYAYYLYYTNLRVFYIIHNFNISVAVDSHWMKCVESDIIYNLVITMFFLLYYDWPVSSLLYYDEAVN